MKPLQIYLFLLVTVLSASNNLQGQNYNNQEIIKNIYDVLQNGKNTSSNLSGLAPEIKWDKAINHKEVGDRYKITFPAVIQNQWGRVLFDRLTFQEIEKNTVLVTGIVKGRKPTECEYVSTQFQHTWLLNEGKITKFSE